MTIMDVPFSFNRKIGSLCQTLLRVLEMSRKRLLTSNSSSNGLQILRVIYKNWLIRESPGFKPGWLGEVI